MRLRPSCLRDFTVDIGVWLLSGVALLIGTGAAALAVILLRAIAFATNVFYCHRLSFAAAGPANSGLGPRLMPLVPVVGGLIVGFLVRYGSDNSRGHGIPEAIQAILLRAARRRESGIAQAPVRGNRNWIGRPICPRGPDHYDRWRVWIAGLSSD
ncbi:MAG: hypothetical protein ABR923_07925 [Terracidiphilus sp.]|jgi:H+/Cl- antiporter ClcA